MIHVSFKPMPEFCCTNPRKSIRVPAVPVPLFQDVIEHEHEHPAVSRPIGAPPARLIKQTLEQPLLYSPID